MIIRQHEIKIKIGYNITQMRILIVEDERKIAAALAKGLKEEHYAVDVAHTGEEGESLACINEYDAVILDIMLPDQDGWQTCINIRKDGIRTPILMLTALDEVADKIRGLDCGADDYLPKPFHFGELLARLRSLVRRGSDVRSAVIEKYGVKLDLSTQKASREGKDITLTSKEFALLRYFMSNADRVLSKTAIGEHVWDMNFDAKSNVIEVFVKYLRQKVDREFSKKLIHTVRGSGYIFSQDER